MPEILSTGQPKVIPVSLQVEICLVEWLASEGVNAILSAHLSFMDSDSEKGGQRAKYINHQNIQVYKELLHIVLRPSMSEQLRPMWARV